MPVAPRHVARRQPIAGDNARVGAHRQEQPCDGLVAAHTRGAQGRAARAEGRVDVRARMHQQPANIEVPLLCRLEERRRAVLLAQVGVSIVVEEEARIGVLAVLTCHHQLRAPVGCAAVLVRVDARLDDQVGRIQVKRAAGGAREGKARVEGRGREGVAARVLDPHAWVGTRFEQQSNAIGRAALDRNQEQRQLGHRRRCVLTVDLELHLKVVSGVRRHALQQGS